MSDTIRIIEIIEEIGNWVSLQGGFVSQFELQSQATLRAAERSGWDGKLEIFRNHLMGPLAAIRPTFFGISVAACKSL